MLLVTVHSNRHKIGVETYHSITKHNIEFLEKDTLFDQDRVIVNFRYSFFICTGNLTVFFRRLILGLYYHL